MLTLNLKKNEKFQKVCETIATFKEERKVSKSL